MKSNISVFDHDRMAAAVATLSALEAGLADAETEYATVWRSLDRFAPEPSTEDPVRVGQRIVEGTYTPPVRSIDRLRKRFTETSAAIPKINAAIALQKTRIEVTRANLASSAGARAYSDAGVFDEMRRALAALATANEHAAAVHARQIAGGYGLEGTPVCTFCAGHDVKAFAQMIGEHLKHLDDIERRAKVREAQSA